MLPVCWTNPSRALELNCCPSPKKKRVYFPTQSSSGFHHADQSLFEKCRMDVWKWRWSGGFRGLKWPLQDELVEVQRKKTWSLSSLVPAWLTAFLYYASLKLNVFLSYYWCCFRAWKRAQGLFVVLYFIMFELLFLIMRLLLRCKLIVLHYSNLSTHRLTQMVVMYFPIVPQYDIH